MGELPNGTRWLAALIGLVFVVGVASGVVRAADDEDDDDDATEQTTTTKSDDDDDKDDETSTTRRSTTTTRATTTTPTTAASTTTAVAGGGGATTTTRPRGTATTAATTTTAAAPANQADLEVSIFRNGNGTNSSTYTVSLHDLGPGDTGPVSITVTAPAGVRLCRVSQTTTDGNCQPGAGSSVTVSGITVPEAGAFIGFRAEGAESCAGDVRVAGSGQAADPNPSNNDDLASGPSCG